MKPKLIALIFTILPHHLISRVVGIFARTQVAWIKNTFIKWYIRYYKVDLSESKIQDVTEFENFNAFFTRELADGARAIDATNKGIICPVDGGVSEIGTIDNNKILQAKGEHYTLEALLANEIECKNFINGRFSTLYLAPKDYHRIHMPITGKLIKVTYVPGRLFSVNQTSVRGVHDLFARNERVIAYFETEVGLMAMVLVGAMIVGSIATQWAGVVVPNRNGKYKTTSYRDKNIVLEKGEQMGKFLLGSTVIVLFENAKVTWNNNLTSNSPIKMGQLLALYE